MYICNSYVEDSDYKLFALIFLFDFHSNRILGAFFIMSKDTFYFSHDYNARNDSKIKKLLSKHGYLGYGLFWAIIEDLYNNANALPTDYDSIAFDLRTTTDIVKSIINDFDLFCIDSNEFGSSSVERRLNDRNEKSLKARKSALTRWENKKEDANVMRTHSDSNAIKERKGKENKLNEIKVNNINERKLEFASTLEIYLPIYGKQLLNEFYFYWTEPNKSNTKFRQELEKTWSLERRLETWAKNDSKFKATKKQHDKSKLEQIINASEEAQPIIESYFKNRNNG